jgi:hypothetical protein
VVAGTRDGSTLSLFAANEFSATVASDVTKEEIGQKRPSGHLPPLRRRAVLTARRLGSFDVNQDAIVDLFTSVRKNTRAHWASGPTFCLLDGQVSSHDCQGDL